MSTTQTVTVLFTDMVGSTALASALDPAAADQVRQDHFSVLRQALAASDGIEVKNLGDGIMAVFGSSSAAIACAVAMQQAVDDGNRRSEHALGLRVGVSGGEVTVEDDDYFGDPVIEAARVCALCEGGQIVITDAVRFMVGRRSAHPFTALGDHELKGLPDPVALHEVGWEPARSDASGVPLPDRLETPSSAVFGFIGRTRERTQLLEALKNANTGTRQVAFLAGEPGIGKTSLCRQLAQQASELDVCVLYGRCDEDLGLSYQPFTEALAHLVVNVDDDVLAAHVVSHGGTLSGLAPVLATRVPDLPPLQSADPDTERARLFNAVVGMLAAASGDSGLLLVLDDLHWADKATLQLLCHIARSNQLAKVMILGTYRDSELSVGDALSDVLATLRREAGVQRIDLVGLEDFEIIEMMERAAGHELVEDGIALAHAVRRETEGNPFFTTEVLLHLNEAGLILQGDDGRWTTTDDLYEQGLPQSVREVVGQRIDRLGPDVRRALSQAAVIGRDFDLDVLAAVAEIDEDDLLDLLDEAGAAGLIGEVEGTVDRYTFTHALTQHTLYEDLGASRRARAHRKVAETLEALTGDGVEARAGELANHYLAATKAADALKAVTYLRMAGDQALARLAPVDALGWFTQALDLYDQIPPDDALHCDLLIGLGTAQRQTGDPAHRETLLQASAMAPDTDRLVRAVLANNRGGVSRSGEVDDERIAAAERAVDALEPGDSIERAMLLAVLTAELSYSSDLERHAQLAAESLEMARRLDDPLTFLRVTATVYSELIRPHNLDERLVDLARAASTATTIGDPNAEFKVRYTLCVTNFQAANLRDLDEQLAACAALADQIDQLFEHWSVLAQRSARALLAGRIVEAEAHSDAALAIGAETIPEAFTLWGAQLLDIRTVQGRLDELVDVMAQAAADSPGLPVLHVALALTYCEARRLDEARRQIEPHVADRFQQFPRDNLWLQSMVILADLCVLLDLRDGFETLYESLAPWRTQFVSIGLTSQGPVALYVGMLAGALGDDRADEHFAEALAISNSMEAPYWVARTEVAWATALAQRDRDLHAAQIASLVESGLASAQQYGFGALERRANALLTP